MTDVLDRGDASPSAAEVRAIVERRPPFDLAIDARLLLAALSTGAGAIHLAMVPSHWGESVTEGIGFAVAGWLQLLFAVAVVARPSRALLRLGILLNAAAIGAWIVSRTAGLPFGAHSGHAESAGFIDITCVAFEAVIIVACIAYAFRPQFTARFARSGLAFAGIAGLGVLALTTAALGSPGARNHAAHSHGDEAAGGSGAAHSHGAGDGAAPAGHSHATPGAADDKGFSLLHNGQHAHDMMIHDLDAATDKALAAQLDVTREVARQTPTVTDALEAGYRRVGPYFPGIGAHFMKGAAIANLGGPAWNPDGVVDDADLRNPLMLIFDGTQPTSRIAGFMYYSMSPYEPTGFIGRNDTWHYHEQLCLKYTSEGIDVPYGLDNSATKAQCDQVGGTILAVSQYMLHVWSVPGFEMSKEYGGMFGEANPKLACADGSYYQLPLDEWAAHPLNVCKAQ